MQRMISCSTVASISMQRLDQRCFHHASVQQQSRQQSLQAGRPQLRQSLRDAHAGTCSLSRPASQMCTAPGPAQAHRSPSSAVPGGCRPAGGTCSAGSPSGQVSPTNPGQGSRRSCPPGQRRPRQRCGAAAAAAARPQTAEPQRKEQQQQQQQQAGRGSRERLSRHWCWEWHSSRWRASLFFLTGELPSWLSHLETSQCLGLLHCVVTMGNVFATF